MNSSPTVCNYDLERANNDNLFLEKLVDIFPESNITKYIPQLIQVTEGISTIQSTTQLGEVLVHVRGDKLSVEFRANFPVLEKTIE